MSVVVGSSANGISRLHFLHIIVIMYKLIHNNIKISYE